MKLDWLGLRGNQQRGNRKSGSGSFRRNEERRGFFLSHRGHSGLRGTPTCQTPPSRASAGTLPPPLVHRWGGRRGSGVRAPGSRPTTAALAAMWGLLPVRLLSPHPLPVPSHRPPAGWLLTPQPWRQGRMLGWTSQLPAGRTSPVLAEPPCPAPLLLRC